MPRLSTFILLIALTGTSFAHGDLSLRVFDLTGRIEIDPGNSGLFLRRGNLNLLLENREAALIDFDRALEIDPDSPDARLGKARTLLALGNPFHALRAIDRFRERYPERPVGWILHARILRDLDRNEEAAQSLSVALGEIHRPEPDLYLERARILVSAGPDFTDEALKGLDEGLRKLGPLVSLQSLAIDLELERENYAGALDRLEGIEKVANRKEKWLLWRGEILLQGGRYSEAEAALKEALARIDELPPRLRGVRATSELTDRIARHIAFLEGVDHEERRDD